MFKLKTDEQVKVYQGKDGGSLRKSKEYMQRPQTEENGALEEPKEIQSGIGKAHSQCHVDKGLELGKNGEERPRRVVAWTNFAAEK